VRLFLVNFFRVAAHTRLLIHVVHAFVNEIHFFLLRVLGNVTRLAPVSQLLIHNCRATLDRTTGVTQIFRACRDVTAGRPLWRLSWTLGSRFADVVNQILVEKS
jgi:hypothetical protein